MVCDDFALIILVFIFNVPFFGDDDNGISSGLLGLLEKFGLWKVLPGMQASISSEDSVGCM